uniref:Leucine-rich repeat-containing N-terminal plant-type domain-containing protein n=1 Tax=Aegilops tauschii subsp. strangulata TaxID=200361 RepID=A0A453CD69_AEGTS
MARSVPGRLALFCVLASCIALAAGTTVATRPSRRGLGVSDSHDGAVAVGVGGGGGYDDSLMPRPAPSSEPRACQFENERLYRAYLVIQKFRKTVICDPKGVTATWAGTDLCGSYKGFFCGRPINVSDRTVASVDLNGFNLRSDSLQGFVDGLPDLALFHANSNNFGGAVPNLRGRCSTSTSWT